VIDLATDGGPAIVYWGRALGRLASTQLEAMARAASPQAVSGGLEIPARLTLVPTEATGWSGTAGFEADGPRAALFVLADAVVWDSAAVLTLRDNEAGLTITAHLEITASGLFTQRLELSNTGPHTWPLAWLALTFPVPATATEILDTTGHHLREHWPQRHEFTIGTHTRQSRRGRTGADATLLQAAGTPGFGWEHGLVHGVHLGWSGNHSQVAERVVSGEAFLQAGELLFPGEITLAPGSGYATPTAYGSWGDGLNQLAHRFHRHIRTTHRPVRRPVTLNTWEAVYFDQSGDKLIDLAKAAARVGVERFVLDDGWFLGRRDDTSGLGDWRPDPAIWPEGLSPLADSVTALGLEFGLWVEPEMVNPDSGLARLHPDWILRGRADLPPQARSQQVLDLANPDVYGY
jgi:alpha-galactosidase